MKQKSVLTRCLALALALLLAVSSANLGLVSQVFAADVKTVALGELIANNYELTEAENALLNSGLLTGTVEYDPFVEDGLVTVDPDNKKITVVMDYKGWVPTSVELVLDGETLETVELDDEGVGYYGYEENMFSVKVMYALDKAVAAEEQEVLLNAAANLQAGLNGMDAANGINGKLDIIVQAIPYLEKCRDGVGVGSFKYSLETDDAKAAVDALAAQIADTNNNGQISLQVANGGYANAISNGTAKAQYLVMNGADYKAVIADTYKQLAALNDKDSGLHADGINIYMDTIGQYPLWYSFKQNLSEVVAALAPYAGEETWDTSSLKSNLTATDYATLDTLVDAITATTVVPSVFETLRVASAGTQVDNNVAKVNVVISWWVATQNLGEYMDAAVWETEILLPVGTSAADVEAEIEARGFEAEAISAFEGFVAEGYTGTVNGLTDALSEAGATYAIDFYPNLYDISLEHEGRVDTLPYGYQITLETPADSKKSYDYTINGVPYQEGTVYTVTEDATIDRKEGAKYYERSLYAIVAENYANDAAKAILTSGALKDDVIIRYRQPNAELLVLKNGTLDASAPQPSYYGTANWIPNTYGPDGTDGTAYSFNGATSVAYGEDVAKVQFKLNLDKDAAAVLSLAVLLKDEADAQTSTLDKLVGYLETMAELNDTALYALNGVIDGTWFVDTNDDGVRDRYDDATHPETVRLRKYFKDIVTKILDENLTGKNLTIYEYLNNYATNGLRYYYNKYATINAEIESLSESLELMLEEEEALNMLIDAAGSQYASIKNSIKDLNGALNEVRTNLTEPNAAINLESENLGALMEALEADGEASAKEGVTVDTPYLISQTQTVMDSSHVMISVEVEVEGVSETYSTKAIKVNSGDTLDAAALLTDVADFLNKQVGTNAPYYTLAITGADLAELGTEVAPTESIKTFYTYTPTKYTVTVENPVVGNATHTITYKNRYVELPVSENEDVVYEYSVGERGVEGYTFKLEELNKFVGNAYTVKCNVISAVNEKLDELVATLNANANGDSYELDADRTTLIANISAEKNVITSIVETFVKTGAYDYIGLNDNALMYVKNDAYEISIQALINALLEDETFSSQTLIDLRDNNGGKLLKTTLKLGDAKDDLDFALDFTLNLNGVPSQMVTAANGLDAVKNYMTFKSAGEHMDVILNLPEKVYEAYLTAMLATGTVDKSDVNKINHMIAYEFFEDYLNTIVENDNITAETFENTLDKLDKAVNDKTDYDLPDYDLSAYDNYYQAFKNALKQNVNITANADDLTFDFDANGQTGIDALVNMLGVDISNFETYLGMVKEYKEGAEPVVAQIVATLTNLHEENSFEAAMVDIRNDAKKNKLDYTTDLEARVDEITGGAIIVLLDDIGTAEDPVDLTFGATTVIDLNGKTIYGNITANGRVFIMDSNLANNNSGTITGALNGDVNLMAGKYDKDVSALVNGGYEQNAEGYVQNKLYTLTEENGILQVNINSAAVNAEIESYTKFAVSLAADLAVDLVANYYTSAALYVADEGHAYDNLPNANNKIYDIDFNDFIDLIDSDSIPTDVLTAALECINVQDLADFINEVVEDLLNLDGIKTAIETGDTIASYTLETYPWAVNLEHIYGNGDDYLTCGVVANEKDPDEITLQLTMSGDYTDEVANAVDFLNTIVMDGTRVELVDVEELTYEDKYFNLTGGAEFDVILDLSDYTTYMAIVMANGTEGAKSDNLVKAVNSGSQNDLKKAFDVLTVKDVINALKVLQRNDDFATLAANVKMNVNINLEGKKELIEKVLIAGLAAAGKALEKLEITGTEATLGNLDKDGDGWYEYEAQYSRSGDVSRRGYGLNYNLTTAEGYVKVNLFAEEYLLGDVNLDGKVTQSDMTMLARKVILNDAEVGEFNDIQLAVADTNQDGKLTQADVTLICRYAVLKDAELEWKPIYITI